MKKALLLLAIMATLAACKKEYSCEECVAGCQVKMLGKYGKRYTDPVRIMFIGFTRSNGKTAYIYTDGPEFDNLVDGGFVTIGNCQYKINYKEAIWYNTGQNGEIEITHILVQSGNGQIMYYPGDFDEYNAAVVGHFIKI